MRRRSAIKRQAILDAAYALFREKGFEKTSVAEINARAGGSKATIYSHFRSKEEIFVECMFAVAERYLEGALSHLQSSADELPVALQAFGADFLRLVCSPDMIALRRLMVAEAERAGTGKLFYEKLVSVRKQVATFIANGMEQGTLRVADAQLAASQLRALLEAELFESLLLHGSSSRPDEQAVNSAAQRAIETFLRAYARDADKPMQRTEPEAQCDERMTSAIDT